MYHQAQCAQCTAYLSVRAMLLLPPSPLPAFPRRSRHRCSLIIKARAHQFAESALPNGLTVRHTSTPAEVLFLYDEVFCQQQYLQQGLTLRTGDTVVDVGANIGMFSLLAAQAVGPTGVVLSVEPAPQTAAALVLNLQHHAAWCVARGQQVARSTVLRVAVADQTQSQVEFTIYPSAPGWSTLARDDAEVLSNMQCYLQSMLLQQPQQADSTSDTSSPVGRGWSTPQRLLVWCARQLARIGVLRGAADALGSLYVRQVMLRGAQTVTVPTATLSRIIQEHQLQCIHLLKVDVERAELQVLQGIQQQHWPLIQQVAMEVHDIDGRLSEVVALLKQQGFMHVVTNQPQHLQGANLHNVYASRDGTGGH